MIGSSGCLELFTMIRRRGIQEKRRKEDNSMNDSKAVETKWKELDRLNDWK